MVKGGGPHRSKDELLLLLGTDKRLLLERRRCAYWPKPYCEQRGREKRVSLSAGRRREKERGGSETHEGLAGALEGVDDVERGDRLALGVLGVGDRVADDVLEEDLEDAARLLVDEARDTLDTATASETADGRLGDALDVVAELQEGRHESAEAREGRSEGEEAKRRTHDLAVALGAALAETLSALATARHDEEVL